MAFMRCPCGNVFETIISQLKSGKTNSCGCLRITNSGMRGKLKYSAHTHIPEYNIWNRMISRCHNANDKSYRNYGGRGIFVCDRWRNSFSYFIQDMGIRPSDNLSIERINNSLGYSTDNCKWASDHEQSRNKRTTRLLTYDGTTLCVVDWANKIGIAPKSLDARINRFKWSIEKSLTTPVRKPISAL